jgi:hypothetical protein
VKNKLRKSKNYFNKKIIQRLIFRYGKDNLNVWLSTFKPMDWQYSQSKFDDRAVCKLITVKNLNDKVVGLHYIGP